MQRRNDHNLATVSGFFRKLDDVFEELPLIDTDHISVDPFVSKVSERSDWFGGMLQTRMSANLEVVPVASVRRELHTKDILACNLVLVAPSEKLGRLSSEHAAHDELDASSLVGSPSEVL